ncbi:MAG: hypothetical protein KAR40_13530 [Candidatus Sabulitectum sp.]|nr:hypothetical protein [Candidatus Sabulitectum sp.]
MKNTTSKKVIELFTMAILLTTALIIRELGFSREAIAGTLLSTVSISISIYGVRKPTHTSNDSTKPVKKLANTPVYCCCLTSISKAISVLEEIRKLQRKKCCKAWESLPGKYSDLRGHLSAVAGLTLEYDPMCSSLLQSHIADYRHYEYLLELYLDGSTNELDLVGINSILASHVDYLSQLINMLKYSMHTSSNDT